MRSVIYAPLVELMESAKTGQNAVPFAATSCTEITHFTFKSFLEVKMKSELHVLISVPDLTVNVSLVHVIIKQCSYYLV